MSTRLNRFCLNSFYKKIYISFYKISAKIPTENRSKAVFDSLDSLELLNKEAKIIIY